MSVKEAVDLPELNADIRSKIDELVNAFPKAPDVFCHPLGDPVKDEWLIYVRNVPVPAIMEAARELAMKSPQWPAARL